MDFYTVVLRKSGSYWVALCLENGLVGQGNTKENAIEQQFSFLKNLNKNKVLSSV